MYTSAQLTVAYALGITRAQLHALDRLFVRAAFDDTALTSVASDPERMRRLSELERRAHELLVRRAVRREARSLYQAIEALDLAARRRRAELSRAAR